MYLPAEVAVLQRATVVKEVRDIHALPCEEQCRKILSELCKTQEKHPNKYCYVKFPFGYIGYSGLKELLSVHESRSAKRCVQEEREWLETFEAGLPSPLCNSILARIKNFIEADVWNGTGSEKSKLLRNLVGKRWISDDSISKVFDILNKQHDDTICFVAKPHGFCCSSLQDKIRATKSKEAKVKAQYTLL